MLISKSQLLVVFHHVEDLLCFIRYLPQTQTKLKPWLISFAKRHQNPCPFWAPVCVPGFKYAPWLAGYKCHCQFASQVEGKFKKRISGNLLNPLGAQNKDIGTASQTLLTEVKLHLQGRLIRYMKEGKHVIMLHSS